MNNKSNQLCAKGEGIKVEEEEIVEKEKTEEEEKRGRIFMEEKCTSLDAQPPIENGDISIHKKESCDEVGMEQTLNLKDSILGLSEPQEVQNNFKKVKSDFKHTPVLSDVYLEKRMPMRDSITCQQEFSTGIEEKDNDDGIRSNLSTTHLVHKSINSNGETGFRKSTIDLNHLGNGFEVDQSTAGQDDKYIVVKGNESAGMKMTATGQSGTSLLINNGIVRDYAIQDHHAVCGIERESNNVKNCNDYVIDWERETDITDKRVSHTDETTPALIVYEQRTHLPIESNYVKDSIGFIETHNPLGNEIQNHSDNESLEIKSNTSENLHNQIHPSNGFDLMEYRHTTASCNGDAGLQNEETSILREIDKSATDYPVEIYVENNKICNENVNNSNTNIHRILERDYDSYYRDNLVKEKHFNCDAGSEIQSCDLGKSDTLSCVGTSVDESQLSGPDAKDCRVITFCPISQDIPYDKGVHSNTSIEERYTSNQVDMIGNGDRDSDNEETKDQQNEMIIHLCDTYLFCVLENNDDGVETDSDPCTRSNDSRDHQCSSLLNHAYDAARDEQHALGSQGSNFATINGIEHSIKIIGVEKKLESSNQYTEDGESSKCMLQNVNNEIMSPVLTQKSPLVESTDSETTNQTSQFHATESNDKEVAVDIDTDNSNHSQSENRGNCLARQYLDGKEERDRNMQIHNIDVSHITFQPDNAMSFSPTLSIDEVDCLLSSQEFVSVSGNEHTDIQPFDKEMYFNTVTDSSVRSDRMGYSNTDSSINEANEENNDKAPSTISAVSEEHIANETSSESNFLDENYHVHETVPKIVVNEAVQIRGQSANGDDMSKNDGISENDDFGAMIGYENNSDHLTFSQSQKLLYTEYVTGDEVNSNVSVDDDRHCDISWKQTTDFNELSNCHNTGTINPGNNTSYGFSRHNDSTVEYGGAEEFIMDHLFHACDQNNTGKVRVSDIIEYLGRIMDTSLENDESINDLIVLLDPDNVNAEIDMDVYRDGLHQWIEAMNKNYDNVQEETKKSFSDYSTTDPTEGYPNKSGGMDEVLIYQTASDADDRTILSSQLLNLQLENQKLNQDKSEAHRLIDSRDDELTRLTREMVEQETKYKRLQDVVNTYAKVEEERSELERQLCSCQENYDSVLDRNKQLEQEKSLLHVQLSRYKKQVTSLTADLSTCRYEKESLENSLVDSKGRLCRHKETITDLEIQLSEKDVTVYELRLNLEQNAHKLQNLEQRNKELETQLTEVQEELTSVEIANAQHSNSTGTNCVLGLKELRHLIEEDVEQPSEEGGVDTQQPSSIQNELKDLLSSCSPEKPWPLSEKEIVDVVCVDGDQTTDVTEGGDSSQTLSKDKDDRPCYNISNERLRWLVNLMRQLKGENNKYRVVLSAMLSKNTPNSDPMVRSLAGGHFHSNPHYRDGYTDREKEAPRTSDTQCESHNGNCMTSLCSVDVSSIVRENKKLREEIGNLRRYNVDLAEKYHLTEVKVQSLEEEVDETKVAWRREKQRCVDLEETLCETALSRQLDLRDIWRLVHKDVEVETEHYTDDNYAFDSKSVETLKKNIKESITSLKHFKKNAFRLPSTSPPTGRHQCNDNGFCCSTQNTPTSPLIEALAIDAFNGNFLPSNCNVNTPDNGVCHNYYHQDCLTGLEPRSASSYPSLIADNYLKQCQCHANINNNCLTAQSGFPTCSCGATISSHININAHDKNGNKNFNVKNRNLRDTNQCFESIENCSVDNKCSVNRFACCNTSIMSHSNEDYSGNTRPNFNPAKQSMTSSISEATTRCSKSHTEPKAASESNESSKIPPRYIKPQSSVGFIPIHKEPPTNGQHHQDPIRKPLANGQSTRKAAAVSGFKGVQYSNEKGNSDKDQIVLLVTKKNTNINKGNGNPTPFRSNEQTSHASDGMHGESIVEAEHVQSVFQCVQSNQDPHTRIPEPTVNRPNSLSWATVSPAPTTHQQHITNKSSTSDSGGIPSSSSSSSPCPSSSSSSLSYTPTDSVNLSSSFRGIQQQTASWHNRSLMDQESLATHLFGVPESIENWDLSPGTGHDTPTLTTEDYQSCPSRMVKMEINEQETTDSAQADCERIQAGSMDNRLNNINGRNSTGKDNNDSNEDANANPRANSSNNNSRNNSNRARRNVNSTSSSTINSSSRPQRQPVVTAPHVPSSSLAFPDMTSLPAVPSTPPSSSSMSRIPIHGDRRQNIIPSTNTTGGADSDSAVGSVPPTNNVTKTAPSASINSNSSSNPSSFSNHSSNNTSIDSTVESWSSWSHDSGSSSPTLPHPNAETSSQPNPSVPVSIAITPCPDDEVGANGEQQRRAETMLVPSSPPSSRHALTGHQGVQPLAPGRLARIRQNRLATKRKGQMKNQKMKLPEVCENSELELSDQACALSSEHFRRQSSPANSLSMPSVSDSIQENHNESHDADDEEMNGHLSNAVTPNLKDSFLHSLGLMTQGPAHDGSKTSPLEDLSEKEIENKFVSLSLAINTDKITVDQRVCVQERARDLAEQNVDRELQGLREAIEALNHSIRDPEVRDIVHRIRRHIQVLEQSAARVSSRAEVYGAVQQERRLCRAIELMVQYTENLRRAREREESDVQEARKIINERSLGIPDFESPSRRSMSVCGANALGRPMRRRSEIVLPKVLGGVGSPSLTQTSSMENICRLPERETPEDGEDARSRFQSAVASTSMKNAVTNTLKRASLERVNSTSSSTSGSPLPQSPSLLVPSNPLEGIKANGALGRDRDRISESSLESKDGKGEENAFQKGYEEGVKAHLSQEMIELRDQQTSLSDAIDEVVDTVTEAQRLDLELLERPTRVRRAMNAIRALVTFLIEYDYRSNTDMIRYIAGGFLVVLAMLVIYFIPSTFLGLHHFSKPPQ